VAATLAGRRIVLTRPAPGPLGDRLRELGADVTQVPLIAIDDAGDGGAALAEVLARLDDFDWLVVTSANGAQRVGAAARRSPVALAAVGSATATTLAELAGRPVDLVPAVQRTAGLLDEFPRRRSAVLVAHGNLAGTDLVDGLRSLGCEVTAVEAYATVLRRPSANELDTLRRADVVVLASGSAATAWVEAERDASGSRGFSAVQAAVVTIGPQTADVARRLGVPVAAVSATPDPGDVIAAIAESVP